MSNHEVKEVSGFIAVDCLVIENVLATLDRVENCLAGLSSVPDIDIADVARARHVLKRVLREGEPV